MANEITTTQTPRPPSYPASRLPPHDPDAAKLTAWCRSGAQMVGTKLQIANYPTPDQRAALQKRHRELCAGLTGHDRKAIGAAVADMLGCYRNALKPGESAAVVAAKYVLELQGLPTWACERTCVAIRLGQAPGISPQFAPTTIELRRLVVTYVAPAQREADEIFEVLNAIKAPTPVSEEERAKIAQKFGRLADELAARAAASADRIAERVIDQKRTQRAAESGRRLIERDYARAGVAPVETAGMLVSPSLLKTLGRELRPLPPQEDAAE